MCSNDQMIVIILGPARHMDFAGTVEVCPHSTYQLQKISQQRDVSKVQQNCITKTKWNAKCAIQSIMSTSHHSDGLSIFLVSAVGLQDDQNYVKRVREHNKIVIFVLKIDTNLNCAFFLKYFTET